MTVSNLNEIIDAEINEQTEQRSQGWFEARIGKFTSSANHRLCANVKRDMTPEELAEYKKENPKSTARMIEDETILSSGALTYVKEAVWETLSGKSIEGGSSIATRWGEEQEGYAREAFAVKTGKRVEFSGFTAYPKFPAHAGGSCDSKIPDENAIIEIKCPYNGGNFIDYCLMDVFDIPNEYYIQMQSNMLFTGTDLCYFIAYDPRLKGDIQLRIIQVPRNKRVIDLIELKLEIAINKKIELIAQLSR